MLDLESHFKMTKYMNHKKYIFLHLLLELKLTDV